MQCSQPPSDSSQESASPGSRPSRRWKAIPVAALVLAALVSTPALSDEYVGEDTSAAQGSPSGFPDATNSESESLFVQNSSDTLDGLANDPPRLDQDVRFLNDRTAVVNAGADPQELADRIEAILMGSNGDAEAAKEQLDALSEHDPATDPQLLVSSVPLRAVDDQGEKAPVDLSLDQVGDNFVPENPVVDLSLPADLSTPATIGSDGIKLDPGATNPADASPMQGDNLFYADALHDTDVVLAPTTQGLETLYQLRSPDSPEQLSMSFSLPEGASLQGTDDGGTDILIGNERIGQVLPAAAHDAEGKTVPVSTSVVNDSIEIDVAHQDAGFSYPVTVDPETLAFDLYDWWHGDTGGEGHWTSFKTPGSPYQLNTACSTGHDCTNGSSGFEGLFIEAPNGTTYAGQAGGWYYTVPHFQTASSPGTSAFISRLTFYPGWFLPGSSSITNPFLKAGIVNPTSGAFVASNTQTTQSTNLNWTFDAPANQTTAAGGKEAVFELTSNTVNTQNLSGWRSAWLGGGKVYLDDGEAPTVSVGESFRQDMSSRWIDIGANAPRITFPVTASDGGASGGLGMGNVQAPGAGSNAGSTLYQIPSESDPNLPCWGTHPRPCPRVVDGANGHPSVTASFEPGRYPDGQYSAGVTAWDALGKQAAYVTWPINFDSTAPEIKDGDVTGDLAPVPADPSAPNALHVHISDGTTAGTNGVGRQSGVKNAHLIVNGEDTVPPAKVTDQPCPLATSSCGADLTASVDPYTYASDDLHFEVTAEDQLGHQMPAYEWNKTLGSNEPIVEKVEGDGLSSWVGPDRNITTQVFARDTEQNGPGVASVGLLLPDHSPMVENVQVDGSDCGGSGPDCPAYTGETFGYSSNDVPEGKDLIAARAKRPSGQTSHVFTKFLKVDRTAPVVDQATLTSSKAAIGLGLQRVNFEVKAIDDDGANESSGVRSVELDICEQPTDNCFGSDTEDDDGNYHSYRAIQQCDAGGCSMDRVFNVDPSQYEGVGASRYFRVRAVDAAGNISVDNSDTNDSNATIFQATFGTYAAQSQH
ncbi:MAG: hypothetical protein QOJ29_4070, partial [Thermoleophilaceae bacterium]|nr:hypothetical protein [Thermoleophilaceae bacterium]